MSEDGNPVCTYSGANSCKKFGFVTTSIELNEHDFLSPMRSENAMKTSSSSTGLPLKSKSVKAWQTEVWKWSLLYNEKPIVDVSTQLTTLHDDQNKVETFWFWKVLLHDRSMWSLLNLAVSKMSDFGFFAGFATWMWNKPVKWGNGRAKHCQCLKNEFLSVHTATQTHAKKFGFVATSVELNEHGFLSPLKPRRKVPADTLSQIWCLAVWTSVFVQELQQIKLQDRKKWNSWEIQRKIQISAEQACTMEKSQWRDMSMSEDGNPVCTYSGANSCKKFGFVTTSIVPVQLDCH